MMMVVKKRGEERKAECSYWALNKYARLYYACPRLANAIGERGAALAPFLREGRAPAPLLPQQQLWSIYHYMLVTVTAVVGYITTC